MLSDFKEIRADPGRLRKASLRDYAIRFAFGGLISAIAGYLGTAYGPTVGGLFLAFPAILPASLTLVKRDDGEEAAGEEALGAVAGAVGLIAFAAVVWGLAMRVPAWAVLLCAAVGWLAVSVAAWLLVRRTGAEVEGNSQQHGNEAAPDQLSNEAAPDQLSRDSRMPSAKV